MKDINFDLFNTSKNRLPNDVNPQISAADPSTIAVLPSLTNGKIWIGNASNIAQEQSISGDATMSNAGVLTLANTAVAAGAGYNLFTVDSKGRITSASTVAYLTANQSITLSGAISGTGTTAISTTIANSAVTLAKIQDIATASVLGRNTGGTGVVEVLNTLPLTVQSNITQLGILQLLSINGANDTNTTNLSIKNQSLEKIIEVTNDGYMYLGNNSSNGVFIASGYQGVEVPDPSQTGQNNLVFSTALGNIAGKGFIFTNPNFTFSPDSGIAAVMAFGTVEFAVTSGTGSFTSYLVNPTINQTVGTGTVRGLHYAPTMTNISGDHYAIETVVGDVMIGTTSGKLKVGTVATPMFQAWYSGEWGFNNVAPSVSQTGYTITNGVTNRSLDVSTATLAQLTEFVGTLADDLKTKGIISA